MIGSAHLGQGFLHAAHEQWRHEAGEEAAGADDHRVERANRLGHDRVNGHLRLEPDPPDLVASRLAGIDFDFAASARAVGILGTDRRALDTDGKDSPAAAEQPAESVHGGEEITAVGLHHREQQVATGVPGEPIVLLERRQT